MTQVSKQADARNAKDAWMMAVTRQRAAEQAMDADMTEANVRAVAAASKAQQKAWAVWDRAEEAAA